MIVTSDQLSICIETCKQIQEECNKYLDVPDYCVEHHRYLLDILLLAFEHAKYMYRIYKLK